MKTLRSWLEQEEQIALTMHIPSNNSNRCSNVKLRLSFSSQWSDH